MLGRTDRIPALSLKGKICFLIACCALVEAAIRFIVAGKTFSGGMSVNKSSFRIGIIFEIIVRQRNIIGKLNGFLVEASSLLQILVQIHQIVAGI